jgi:hypothetical protein
MAKPPESGNTQEGLDAGAAKAREARKALFRQGRAKQATRSASASAPRSARYYPPSVQPELAIDGPEFSRLYQTGMGDHDRVQRPVEFAGPEVEELPQLGKVGVQIVPLPDEILQNGGVIRHAVEDVRGGEPEALELAAEIH